MKVLIACETSGVVRNAFLAHGHDTWSCDILPSDDGSNRHIRDDVRNVLAQDDWDLFILSCPPCTRLCNSGVRWLHKPATNPIADLTPEQEAEWPHMTEQQKLDLTWQKLDEGAALFSDCWNADVPHVSVENPVAHKYAKERIRNFQPHSQSVQPWQFGTDPNGPDNEKKRTCLWLRNLPKLKHTGTLDGTQARNSIHSASPGPNRWKVRSKFFPGIAQAMAEQWTDHFYKTTGYVPVYAVA